MIRMKAKRPSNGVNFQLTLFSPQEVFDIRKVVFGFVMIVRKFIKIVFRFGL